MFAVRSKNYTEKAQELKKIKENPAGFQYKPTIDALLAEIPKSNAIVTQRKATVKAELAEAEQILTNAHVAHEPLAVIHFPTVKSWNQRMRTVPIFPANVDHELVLDERKSIDEQTLDTMGSLHRTEEAYAIVCLESQAMEDPCQGLPHPFINPTESDQREFTMGWPEAKRHNEIQAAISLRLNYLSKKCGEKQRALRLPHYPFLADHE